MSSSEIHLGRDILSPVTGNAIPLDQVPDPVFSQKIIGDGIAVIPTKGTIVSPVDGEVASVAETLHAFGFRTEDGLELLIHVGLETVGLKGECFEVFVKPGDKVKAGDPVAKVDLEFLAARNINPVTPVLVCGGMEGKSLDYHEGQAQAGRTAVLTVTGDGKAQGSGEGASAAGGSTRAGSGKGTGGSGGSTGAGSGKGTGGSGGSAGAGGKESLSSGGKGGKIKINFDFLQKLGKVLMVVIAVMPAAGLMISLGKLVQMAGADVNMVLMVGSTMENIGWAVINNLHILFAVAIGGSWAKERAGGAFAAVIAFILINCITGAIFGVTAGMLNDPDAVTHTLFGQEILVNGYFTSVLGAPALNMGVFVGIISGFAGGMIYNKYYNYRKLPDALAFFNGKRFVPMVVIVWSVIISAVLAVVWPVVQTGINNFGVWIANSSSTSPVLAPFIYGTLERLLLPFGLHHMLTIPMNYTSFGGTYTIQTGINAGSQVFGQDPLWLAWVTDLINFKDAGDMASYTNLMETVIPARFQVGQMIGPTGLLLGIALAEKERKKVRLNIYGMGEQESALKALTEKLHIKDKVFFGGWIPNDQVPIVLNQMDVFVLGSESESFGVAAVEAMACGLPVVATCVSGFREVVEDGVTGFLVPVGDAERMAGRMRELYRDEGLRLKMGERGRKRVEQLYEWDSCVDKMIEYYREIAF